MKYIVDTAGGVKIEIKVITPERLGIEGVFWYLGVALDKISTIEVVDE